MSQPSLAAAPAPVVGNASATAPPALSTQEINDQAVIQYLKKKGLGTAALELEQLVQGANKTSEKGTRERLQLEDATTRNQRSLLTKSTGSGYYGYDRDSCWPIVQWGVPDSGRTDLLNSEQGTSGSKAAMGVEEARAHLDAFVTLQLWVLSLPDGDADSTRQVTPNPIELAHKLVKADGSLQDVIKALVTKQKKAVVEEAKETLYNLPPSCKAELIAISFALLVHTYCELLEVGMESTAHVLRDAFKPVYDTIYPEEYRDLLHCATIEDIVKLNSYNSQHMEAISALKSILVQVASYQTRRDEIASASLSDPQQLALRDQKVQEYDKNIGLLKQKYGELSERASAAFERMSDLPFLRRARAVRWQLKLSTASYHLLCGFLNARDESLLVMSSLLQTKCELHVEQRDPLPITPACVLIEDSKGRSSFDINQFEINWAAPAPVRPRSNKLGETIPYPKFHLDPEYENEVEAAIDKKRVEFNRALLINGFRRLEAIEKKREYETMPDLVQKRIKGGDAHLSIGNPLDPSILLTTLTSSSSGPVLKPKTSLPRPVLSASHIWEESDIGLCCARASPPDGRRIAVGCDDAAVRVWNATDADRMEPSVVLLGHKNGFPVFDVDWNRDGRCLLSAGGDGSVRLWDTMAVGPFGNVAEVSNKISSETMTAAVDVASPSDTALGIAGTKAETAPYTNGAALAVYRGHVPNTPIWSVSFAPSGYYFCSAGGDATARLWVTDRSTSPVRLFSGHTAANVNCVEWHPNCNYVLTGSDDRTVRLWDIQTGRTVRLLDGCGAGVNTVEISPNGQYAAGADLNGVVHVWDLGMGKKITELRSQLTSQQRQDVMMIHSLSFSQCGSVLATGGDDCCVRIWDVRYETISQKPIIATPSKTFATRKTMIMDLSFTRRNLLLSVGKYVTPVPLAMDASN
jgi:transcription initiation factor TFIID subunit 5